MGNDNWRKWSSIFWWWTSKNFHCPRAAKGCPIILLDEATASLDVENETKIQVALSKLIQNKTVMVIAHRMRTVMNDGKVAECGTPKELLEKDGIFTHMVEL